MRRLVFSLSIIALVAGFIATPPASAQQSVNLYVGGFASPALDSRGTHDVAFQNLGFATFDINDFDGATVGGEWLVGLGDHFDAGIGVGFYQRTSPAIYTKFAFPDQSDIVFDQKLRVVPVTATIRFLPMGHHGPMRPYIGGGVGIFAWRYSESGNFVDLQNKNNIFPDVFTASGTRTGPVILAGITFPIGNVGLGGEIRYQAAKANLTSDWPVGTTVDLGGMNYLFMVNVRF